MIDFFDEEYDADESPLANRMRPKTLDEICGQKHILGKGKLLRRMIESDSLKSIILWGPPGCGKTTIANVIANVTGNNFIKINATTSGKKEMEDVINDAKKYKYSYGGKTILFIDEIHRFSKSQQDFLLSHVENGTIILIGATTESPFFEIIRPLLSRSTLFELKPLAKSDIKELLKRASEDRTNGIKNPNVIFNNEVIDFWADIADGDARLALNAMELAASTTAPSIDGKIYITKNIAEECIQKKVLRYDKQGTNHYDTISAFIKSIRGSDPDAAIYYLAMMLEAGESIDFIARRLVILASEDIGLADPMGLVIATNAMNAVRQIGMPESRIILSEATLYLANAKKSNSSIMAIDSAIESVRNISIKQIPPHLQDAHYNDADTIGRGVGYKYPHNYDNHFVEQQYLPDELINKEFYIPSNQGAEKKIIKRQKEN